MIRWLWIGTALGNAFVIVPSFFWLGTYCSQDSQDIVDIKQKMASFKQTIGQKGTETYISLDKIPMPGETMVWLIPGETQQWETKLKNLKESSSNINIKAQTVQELQSWCQVQRSISKVYLTKEGKNKLKIKTSQDSDKTYHNLSEITDFTDLKNYCSRPITNREWYGNDFLQTNKEIQLNNKNKSTCLAFLEQPYSSSSATFLKPCLISKK